MSQRPPFMTTAQWRKIPKTECHVHLEGSVGTGLIRKLHRKHRGPWAQQTLHHIRRTLSFSDFPGFLCAFRSVCASFRHPDDYRWITQAFFRRLKQERVIHCEFFFTPSAAERFGLDAAHCLSQILTTAEFWGRRYAISWGVILDGVRQFPPSVFETTVRLASRFRSRGVIGIGMGGDELATPLSVFQRSRQQAEAEGLRVTLHTGEIGTPETMWNDICTWKPDRIGHGLAAVHSRNVMRWLVDTKTPVDISLTGNLRTGVIKTMSRHPLPFFLAQGVRTTLGSDDPSRFGTTLSLEYRRAERLLRSTDQMALMLRYDTDNPLLPPLQRAILEDRNRQWVAGGSDGP